MKIPDNFKKKYSLVGESYDPKNVDAALSELLTVSGRLYKENSDLKAEVERLHAAAANAKPEDTASVDISGLELTVSGLEAMITALEQKIDAIRTAVNDTLCVANDAAISAKKAEDAAAEAKTAADAAKTAAEGSRDAAEDALDAAESARGVAEAVQNAVEALDDKLDNVNAEIIPMIFADDPASEEIDPAEEVEEIKEIEEIEQIEELKEIEEIEQIEEFKEIEEIEAEQESEEGGIAEDECDLPEEEEAVILAETETLEAFEDEPEVVEGSEKTEEPEALEETEVIEESEAAEKPEEVDAIADDLIRTVGLDSEPEEIEPAAPVGDDELSAKLAEMYSAPAEQEESAEEAAPAPEEKPAQSTSFNDMKTALDAIRARLKK